MLNPFPSLLMYGILAPMIIRVTIGAFFFYLAVCHYRGRKDVAHVIAPLVGKLSKFLVHFLVGIEAVIAVLLIFGAWTQIAAIIAIVLSLKFLILRSKLRSIAPLSHATYLLLAIMGLSLLLTGAGLPGLSFDLPL